ncbi:uncharacterized protein LY79DRAFT_550576 [Colletotrichum navitas]|uniref:Uncharacterized protein n=1 Tax=Colletotrichum navitas TaxID=681940 RepID=A0AAD8Q215_9PEZI|nr:uncharacterized protein LY79DRAFT_550576 [Colletotrichum navitas]KAK1594010.1 hypothetical protein LY79DRAFT_550576 [Colletotrichum navitas]
MPRRTRSSKRPHKHRQENFEPTLIPAQSHAVDETHHQHRSRKDRKPARGCRSSSVPYKPSRKQRHDRHTRRTVIEMDTDGDFTMLPTPPASPETPSLTCTTAHKDSIINTGVASSRDRCSNPESCVSLRSSRVFPGGSSTAAQQSPGDTTLKNFRFRHYLLSMLDQQRAAVELWADSVGAGGPAEPMDWQPEQERIVYIARDPVEYGCYEDRWRMDRMLLEGWRQQQSMLAAAAMSTPVMVQPELGLWTGDTRLGGPTVPVVWGDSAPELCFLDEIE